MPKPKPLKHVSPVSRAHLAIFILIFAAIGGIIIWRSLAAPNPSLPGDLNNDNTVNVTDLSILLSDFNTSNAAADINSDGTVNILDLSALLSHYGQSVSSKPSIPTGLTATPGDTKVTLNWTANPSSDSVDTYQVYWSADSAFNTFSQNLSVTGTGYSVTGLANGTTYYFRISAHNSAGYGDWGNAISSTPQGSGGTSGGPGTGFTGPWRDTSYTVPTTFTKVITTANAFTSLVSAGGSLVPGDVVHVVGPMKLAGCPSCTTNIVKHLSSPASIYFDSNVVFAGDSTTTKVGNSSVNVDASNIYMYGGQVAGGMANEGVRVGPSFGNDTQNVSNIRWWGLKVHDVGGGGVDSFGEKNTAGVFLGSDHLDFDIETWNLGLNSTVIDPHCQNGACGTGVHAIYIGGGFEPPGMVYVNNSKFSVYTHDTADCVGDAQVGESVQNTELWIRGANLSFTHPAGGWTAARVFTPWNGAASTYNDANITVHDVEGHNISGQIVSTDSLSSGPITVEYGRAVNALTWSTANSYYSGKPFQPNSHVAYQNVQ